MTQDEREHGGNFIGFLLWVLWIAIVTLVLGGMAYLFVGGSSLFSEYNSVPVVVYRQIDQDIGTVSVNGSVLLSSDCYKLTLDMEGDEREQVLNFTTIPIKDCKVKIHPAPETFFAEFVGSVDTSIRVIIDGIEQEVILK